MTTAAAAIDAAVADYRRTADIGTLLERLETAARAHATPDLITALEPHHALHEVVGPVYEVIVEREPGNARALVGLANAYWLTGRGPEVVGALAERAREADPANRAAWHLWAITAGTPRERTERWHQIVERDPEDDLARVNLADNAASLAGSENDPVALKLAISSYERLLARATRDDQRAALGRALATLRNWTP